MPRNSAGTYTLPESAFVPNTAISSAAVNSDFSDIADAITGSLSRSGQGGMVSALGLSLSGFFYTSDPDTGMNRSAANTQVVTCGGQDWTFTTTDLTSPDGSSLLPLIGEIKMWAFPTAPSGFIFMRGQAATTTYPLWRAGLIAAGNPYGTSGGDPLFPNLQCVVPVGLDATARGLLTGSTVLGATFGSQVATVAEDQLPNITVTGTVAVTPHGTVGTSINNQPAGGMITNETGSEFGGGPVGGARTLSATSTFTGTTESWPFSANPFGSGHGHANVQPTIVLNFIGRAA